MKPIIVVENVSKKYSINSDRHRSYHATDLFRELFGMRNGLALREDEFLAVNGVSLHLYPGESFALVGRNGSGKTTLLKMMNGLIKPDGGTIILEGRVQALINLGAGFNPALTGRDNIFNSAAFMGLSRRETEGIVDAVIDFSELEEFIDTPVQNYSQGMHARLGFSVAIHLKPNILLIDEILAVGDHAFQNKCFARLGQLKKDGVTIVLVTHSHTNVVQLCERALWIHKGKAMKLGPAREVTQAYLDFLDGQEVERLRKTQTVKPAAGENGAATILFSLDQPEAAKKLETNDQAEIEAEREEATGELRVISKGTDPIVLLPKFDMAPGAKYGLIVQVTPPAPTELQVFPELAGGGFREINSQVRRLREGENAMQIELPAENFSGRIRLDPGKIPGLYRIGRLEVGPFDPQLALGQRTGGESLYGPIHDEMRKIEDLQFEFASASAENDCVRMHERLELSYSFRLREEAHDLNVSLAFYREDGLHVSTISTLNGDLLKHAKRGRIRGRAAIPDFNLAPGRYVLVMPIHEGKSYLFRDVVRRFVVVGDGRMTWGLADFSHEYQIDVEES